MKTEWAEIRWVINFYHFNVIKVLRRK